jgi:hypothetical protein
MAKRIAVLDCHQSASDSPARYVKKTVGLMLVRRALAEQLSDNLIRMMVIQSAAHKAAEFRAISAYIPKVLPPRELPGVFWQAPQSDQWKIQHGPANNSSRWGIAISV